MNRPDAYEGHSIWLTELVETASDRLPLSTGSAGLLTLGTVPLGFTALFFLLADGRTDLSFLLAHLSAASIAVAGPVLVWHYDERIFPTFLQEASDVAVDRSALVATIERYERIFAEKSWFVVVPWTLLVVGLLLANMPFFEAHGVTGSTDPALFAYLGFAIWWGIVTGIGFHGAITTIRTIRAVGELELTVDPLHHDGLGGLSTIGYFSIRATLLISIGSFALPLAFAIAASGPFEELVYVAVAIYVGIILLSFVYPTVYVNRRAQEVRDRILREKREQIRSLRAAAALEDADGDLAELETQLKISTLREEFHEYQSVTLYPLSVSILARLASSILLPIAFTVLETYVLTG